MGKKTLAMTLALVFLFTTLFSFNVLAGEKNTSVHVKIDSGETTIKSVAIKMGSTIIPLNKQNAKQYNAPDGGDYVFDQISHIIITRNDDSVVAYSPASFFGGTEGGGTINYTISPINEGDLIIPNFTLTKSVSPTTSYTWDEVTYSFTVTNNIATVLNNVTVTDSRLGFTETITSISGNGNFTFTKPYTTTSDDFESGVVYNIATASAIYTRTNDAGRTGTITVTDTDDATFNVSGYTLAVTHTGSGEASALTPPQADGPNAGKYSKGTVVTLTATPATDWTFGGWTAEGGTVNSNQITINANTTVSAIFLPPVPESNVLTVEKEGEGTVTPDIGDHPYLTGSAVTLSAIAAEGWRFVEWLDEEGYTVPDSNNQITMDDDKKVKAIFEEIPDYTLTVAISGSGIVVPDIGDHEYKEGTTVPLSATPASGWRFDGWLVEDSSTPNPELDSVVMNSNRSLTAVFSEIPEVTYILTVDKQGEGTVTPDVGSHTYDEGTVVTLTANPASGWEFSHWEIGEITTTAAVTAVTMDANQSATAVFNEKPVYHTLTVDKQGEGSVTPDVGPHSYLKGSEVTLTAIESDPDYEFSHWEIGEITTTAAITTVTMDSDINAKAVFDPIEVTRYKLTINIVGNGSVNTSTEAYFALMSTEEEYYWPETTVLLEAIPDSGWYFVGWSGDVTGSDREESVFMDGNKTVTATFAETTTPPPSSPPPSSPPPSSPPPYYPPEKVTLNIVVVGQGTVLPSAGDYVYDKGTFVQLTAQAAEGWEFKGWQGGTINAYNQIHMDENKKVTALFEEINKPEPTPTPTPTPTPAPTPTPPPVIIPVEPLPTGLPKTGGIPAGLLYGLGGLITTIGVVIRKKHK